MTKSTLLLGTAGLALICATPAAARQATTSQPAVKGPEDRSGGGRSADDRGGVEEIIVTAQRRSERLQDVPIAISAASADTLDNLGATNLTDVAAIAPSVTVATGLGGAAITIRGVGGTGSGADEGANAVYVDGVYQANPASVLFEFNNIERVEVLKGPQGTLFGRNASGGLIQVVTRTPQFEPEMKVNVGYGNYETVRADAYVTGGLTDTVAMDIALNYQHQGQGWGRNVTTSNDTYRGASEGARAKLLWNIGSDTILTATALYAKSFLAGLQGSQVVAGQTTFLPPTRPTGRATYQGFYNASTNIDQRVGTEQRNFAATFKHDFGFATFTSITSRDLVKFQLKVDADLGPTPFTNVDINSSVNTWTQELQLASGSPGPLQWVAGLFYLNINRRSAPTNSGFSQDSTPPIQTNVDAFTRTSSETTTESYAAYAQATLEVTPGTRMTAGLRYTKDESRIDFVRFSSDPAPGVNQSVTFPRETSKHSKLGWRFAVDQKLTDNVLMYASYSRGFKSGLFNATNPGLPVVSPQTIDAYEIGLKSELFDRRVRANVSAFRNDLEGIQLRGIPEGFATPIFYNAASARFYGVDAEIAVQPTRNLNFQANVAYLDGKYGDGFNNALFFTPRTAFPFGLVQGIGNASGKRTVYSPEWVIGLTGQYKVATPVGDFQLAGSYTYNDGFFFDPQNRVAQPSFGMVNGSISWKPQPEVQVRIWASNLFDKQVYSGLAPGPSGDQYFPGAPQTYGVTLGWSFGGQGR